MSRFAHAAASSASQRPVQRPLIGIGLLVLSLLSLTTLDASGKWVMATGIPLFILVWFRYLMQMVRCATDQRLRGVSYANTLVAMSTRSSHVERHPLLF